jgi:putative transcriptional regulator
LKQPEVGKLIPDLWQVSQLTQEQLAVVLGVTYSPLNRWEKEYMQLSSSALRQIDSVIDHLSRSPLIAQREAGDALLNKYFVGGITSHDK